jgi:hypothetical protein
VASCDPERHPSSQTRGPPTGPRLRGPVTRIVRRARQSARSRATAPPQVARLRGDPCRTPVGVVLARDLAGLCSRGDVDERARALPSAWRTGARSASSQASPPAATTVIAVGPDLSLSATRRVTGRIAGHRRVKDLGLARCRLSLVAGARRGTPGLGQAGAAARCWWSSRRSWVIARSRYERTAGSRRARRARANRVGSQCHVARQASVGREGGADNEPGRALARCREP